MILPNSYYSALALLILSVICWGSWANTQKIAGGRWRFELYCFDFALGTVLCAIIAAFTFGSLDSKELTFQDNLLITGYRNMIYAIAAGMVFSLGNMLLAGAISVSGLSIAFPVGLGMALVTNVVLTYILNPLASPRPLFSGVILVLAAVTLAGAAYTSQIEARRVAANKAAAEDPNAPPRRRLPRAGRGITLTAVGGVVLGLFYPVLTNGAWTEPAISPYGTALLFSGGVLLSTFLYNPFFMNFPVQGRPVGISAYFKGGMREHLLGLLGGAIWMTGGVLNFLVANSSSGGPIGSSMSFALGQAAALVGTIWGLIAWREFKDSPPRAKLLMTGMFLFFVGGMAAVTVAQMSPR
jgi:glucose uptake protein